MKITIRVLPRSCNPSATLASYDTAQNRFYYLIILELNGSVIAHNESQIISPINVNNVKKKKKFKRGHFIKITVLNFWQVRD